jgi:hypothetical protein
MEYMQLVINNALYLSLLLIIVSSVISVFFAGRKKDRCLKDFNRFLSYVYMKNGRHVYGVLRVFGTGIELVYRHNHQDKQGHIESSFILYSWEFAEIKYVKRFHKELALKNRKKRIKDIRTVHHPSIFRMSRRKLRNFLSTFQDGITRSLNTVINTFATRNPKSRFSQQQKDISGIGTQVVDVACHSYDPIIESYIGHFIVLELLENGVINEYCGILKEYTQNFLEVLNVMEIESYDYQIRSGEAIDDNWLNLHWKDNQFCIENKGDWPVFIQTAYLSDSLIIKDHLLAEKNCFRLDHDAKQNSDSTADELLDVHLLVPNIFDMVVPRPLGQVRHGCPRRKHNIETFIGSSTSNTLNEALYNQFIMQVNVKKREHPEEIERPN